MTNILMVRGHTVQDLAAAFARGESGLSAVPGLVKEVLLTEAWRERTVPQTKQQVGFKSFQAFVEAPLLDGLNTTVDMVQRLCADDPDVLRLIQEATNSGQGHKHTNGMSKAIQGNTRGYTLHRLQQDHTDLYQQVIAKKLSTNAAAVAAGIRKPTHTIPHDVDAAARALRAAFPGAAFDQLRAALHAVEPCTQRSETND